MWISEATKEPTEPVSIGVPNEKRFFLKTRNLLGTEFYYFEGIQPSNDCNQSCIKICCRPWIVQGLIIVETISTGARRYYHREPSFYQIKKP